MKRFRFPLRPVALLRAHHESRAQDAYRAAQAALVSAERQRDTALARVRALADALDDHRRGTFCPLLAAATFRAYSEECQVAARDEQAVLQARDAMHRARAAYLRAHQELKVVHRLEDKARAAHLAACRAQEQNALDELAASVRGRALPTL